MVAHDQHLSSSYNPMALGPEGNIEQCKILSSSELLLSGWPADLSPGGSVAEVQIWIDGKMLARTTPTVTRRDVALAFNNPTLEKIGWQLSCSAPATNTEIIVNTVSNYGAENFLRPLRTRV